MAIEFYKPDGAKASRGLTALGLGALLLFGSLSLYDYLAIDWWMDPFPGFGEALGEEFPMSPRTILTLVLMAASGFFIHWLCNYPKYVDFLIETEAELKKVTWPSQAEVQSSSTIVIIVTVVLGLYIFVVDVLLILIRDNVDIRTLFG